MPALPEVLSIGELASRAGVATSALRFYEERGLISSRRTAGNQRRYPRATLRRVATIRAAQAVGVTLAEIGEALASLPEGRTPTASDWAGLSARWRESLDERIERLEALRDELSDCIGCGCLSLDSCGLLNPSDIAAASGPGPRYLEGDPRPEPPPSADGGGP